MSFGNLNNRVGNAGLGYANCDNRLGNSNFNYGSRKSSDLFFIGCIFHDAYKISKVTAWLSDTHRKSLVSMKGMNNMEQVVTSSAMPPKITYQPMGDGKAFVMLRKNIKKVTETMYGENGETTTEMYQYNEKQFYTKLSEEEVTKKFDSLYLTADVPTPSITEQINNISDVLNDVLDRMDELESKGE